MKSNEVGAGPPRYPGGLWQARSAPCQRRDPRSEHHVCATGLSGHARSWRCTAQSIGLWVGVREVKGDCGGDNELREACVVWVEGLEGRPDSACEVCESRHDVKKGGPVQTGEETKGTAVVRGVEGGSLFNDAKLAVVCGAPGVENLVTL
jgi:hypothetical protein